MQELKWLLVLWVGASGATGSTAADAREAVPRSAISVCEQCHGQGGHSKSGLVPRINGQRPHYILRRLEQLTDTKAHLRAHAPNLPARWDSQITDYFSALSPTPAKKSDPSRRGAEIYRYGIPARHVAACSYCHGALGEGSGPIPRLAGQHKAYLEIRLDLLSGVPLPGSGAMHLAVGNVTPAEIDAVTSYLAAQ